MGVSKGKKYIEKPVCNRDLADAAVPVAFARERNPYAELQQW